MHRSFKCCKTILREENVLLHSLKPKGIFSPLRQVSPKSVSIKEVTQPTVVWGQYCFCFFVFCLDYYVERLILGYQYQHDSLNK